MSRFDQMKKQGMYIIYFGIFYISASDWAAWPYHRPNVSVRSEPGCSDGDCDQGQAAQQRQVWLPWLGQSVPLLLQARAQDDQGEQVQTHAARDQAQSSQEEKTTDAAAEKGSG